MNYFNEEHSLFRESLRDFLSREVSPNISFGKKKVEYLNPFGKKWEIWDFLACHS